MQHHYKDEQVAFEFREYEFLPDFMGVVVINQLKEMKNIEKDYVLDLMLDAGCGNGASTRMFTKHFKKIIGFDVSTQQLEMANKIEHGENITYMVGNANNMPADDNSVDVIVSSFAAHFFDLDEFVGECKRVLKDDGYAMLMAFNYYDIEIFDGRSERQPGKVFFDEYFKKASEYFRDHIPGEVDLCLGYQPMYDRIKGVKKERIDDILHSEEMTLGYFKKHLLSIAEHKKFAAHEVNAGKTSSLDDLMMHLKKYWQVEDMEIDKIPVKLTVSMFVIILSKT